MIVECVCREAAIASWAQRTDFAANLRPVDWLITHPSEVGFTTDTKAVIIILKITILELKKKKKIEKQELKPSVISVSPRSSAYGGLSPRVNVRTDVNACDCDTEAVRTS